jgi:hypothetical protein
MGSLLPFQFLADNLIFTLARSGRLCSSLNTLRRLFLFTFESFAHVRKQECIRHSMLEPECSSPVQPCIRQLFIAIVMEQIYEREAVRRVYLR